MNAIKRKAEIFDLGTRRVTEQNFSTVCTLPKIFTDNYLGDNKEVQVTMCAGKLTLEPVAVTETKK